MIKLDLPTIRHYVFSKHNIAPNTQIDSIETIAENLVGIHSARLSTPYVALISRTTKFEPQNLRDYLYTKRKLIKLRCMRKTLHTATFDIAPIMHTATLSLRIVDSIRIFKLLNVKNEKIEELQTLFHDLFTKQAFSSNEIENFIFSQKSLLLSSNDKKFFTKYFIKYLWETGVLCYMNSSNKWFSESRLYTFTDAFYPALELEFNSVDNAEYQLIHQHINQYGPVSLKDISWWSGLGINKIKKHISQMVNNKIIVRVFIADSKTDFYMTDKDYQFFTTYKKPTDKWVRLLAYEDPSLKGYFESRWRYVSDKNYKLLFNQIGEVRASVISQGVAVGVWEWDKKQQKVNLQLFKKIDDADKALLKNETDKMEFILRMDYMQKYLL